MIHSIIFDNGCVTDEYVFGLGDTIRPVSVMNMVRLAFNRRRWHVLAFYLFLIAGTVGTWLLLSFA